MSRHASQLERLHQDLTIVWLVYGGARGSIQCIVYSVQCACIIFPGDLSIAPPACSVVYTACVQCGTLLNKSVVPSPPMLLSRSMAVVVENYGHLDMSLPHGQRCYQSAPFRLAVQPCDPSQRTFLLDQVLHGRRSTRDTVEEAGRNPRESSSLEPHCGAWKLDCCLGLEAPRKPGGCCLWDADRSDGRARFREREA